MSQNFPPQKSHKFWEDKETTNFLCWVGLRLFQPHAHKNLTSGGFYLFLSVTFLSILHPGTHFISTSTQEIKLPHKLIQLKLFQS